MIDKPVDAITKDDIDALAAGGTRERRTLDYKQELPGNSDEQRKEFVRDISSFANTAGGDILYGVEDIRDANGKPTGTPKLVGLANFNEDVQKLRLDQMIRTGIAPRLPAVELRAIEGFPAGPILVVRIRRSWLSLHMVTLLGDDRFYARSNAGRYRMDVVQVREGFLLTDTIPDRARNFRADRVARIVGGELPVRLPKGPRTVLHLVPVSALVPSSSVEVSQFGRFLGALGPISGRGRNDRYNLDGYMTYAYSEVTDGEHAGYVLLMRNGAIEAVDTGPFAETKDGKIIRSNQFDEELFVAFDAYRKVQGELGLSHPTFVFLTLVDVAGYRMAVKTWPDTLHLIDRDVLMLPDILIQSPAESSEASKVLRPALDALWQASGYARSENYAEDGTWRGQ